METRGNPFTFEAGRRRASSWVFPNAARGNGLVVADSPTQTPGPEAASAQRTRGKSAVERIDIPTTTSATTSAPSPGEADRGPISPGHFAIFHFARAPEPRNPIRGLTMATCRAARGKYRQSPRRAAPGARRIGVFPGEIPPKSIRGRGRGRGGEKRFLSRFVSIASRLFRARVIIFGRN